MIVEEGAMVVICVSVLGEHKLVVLCDCEGEVAWPRI